MPSTLPPGVPEDAPSIGDGRYVLVARIGAGGMAGVYRTWDSRLRVWRAVKVLFPEYAKRPKLRQRFASEAHTMARLEHPNLVRIYDVGDAGPLPFIVMELVSGGTLIHWIAHNGAMSPRMALDVTLQLCRGVAEAHAAGVVHRDVKPHNVLISPSGHCKLTDFGIAQDEGTDLTKTGSTMGTLGYMAPEQRNDAKSVDARADIFSIGATLWTLLAGEPAHDLFVAHENLKMVECVPEELRPALLRCVAYDREARYPDVGSLIADLEAVSQQLPEDPPYAPELVRDLTEEEPIEDTPSFPEIRAIIDGAAASAGDPVSDEVLKPPAGQKKALPYFMPSAAGRSNDDDELPDYIDREVDDSRGDEFVIGVDSAHVRDDVAPPPRTEPEEEPEEEPSYLHFEMDDPGYPDEGEEEERQSEREPGRRAAPIVRAPPTPVVAPQPKAPPPPPGEEESSPLVRMASLASIPIGLFLAFSTLVVVVLMLYFGYGAYNLYGAATAANDSRQKLYSTLNADRAIVEQLAGFGADRAAMEDRYIEWLEQRGEPARYRSAERFLDAISAQADAVLTDEGSATQRETEHVVRRIRSARIQYEANIEDWEDLSSSLTGRFLIFVGAGSPPPM